LHWASTLARVPLPRAVEAVVDGDPDAAVVDVRGVGPDENRLAVLLEVAPAMSSSVCNALELQ
jgi:hypothetical protein